MFGCEVDVGPKESMVAHGCLAKTWMLKSPLPFLIHLQRCPLPFLPWPPAPAYLLCRDSVHRPVTHSSTFKQHFSNFGQISQLPGGEGRGLFKKSRSLGLTVRGSESVALGWGQTLPFVPWWHQDNPWPLQNEQWRAGNCDLIFLEIEFLCWAVL